MGRRYRRRSKGETDPVAAIAMLLVFGAIAAWGAITNWWQAQPDAGQLFLIVACAVTALAGVGAVVVLGIYSRRRENSKIQRMFVENGQARARQEEAYVRQERNALKFRQFADVNPAAFERAVGTLFAEKGFQVTHSGRTGDGGVDLELAKDGLRYIVQCKRFTRSPVGEPMLRDFYGTLTHRGADHGFFVTTSRFTPQAKTFAQYKPFTLVDKDELQRWLDAG